GGLFQQMIGGPQDFVLGYAEHAGGGFVMTGHFGFSVSQSGPGTRIPHFLWSRKQSAGIGDRAPANGATMKDGCMPEETHIEKSAQPKPGTPKPAVQGPAGPRQVGCSPAPAHLHDGDFVSFFRQPVGGDTAAKT